MNYNQTDASVTSPPCIFFANGLHFMLTTWNAFTTWNASTWNTYIKTWNVKKKSNMKCKTWNAHKSQTWNASKIQTWNASMLATWNVYVFTCFWKLDLVRFSCFTDVHFMFNILSSFFLDILCYYICIIKITRLYQIIPTLLFQIKPYNRDVDMMTHKNT